MELADLRYGSGDTVSGSVRDIANDRAAHARSGVVPTVSIFADRAHVRGTMRDDAAASDFTLNRIGTLADLFKIDSLALGEAVLLDCPFVDGATLAALARLDMRVSRADVHLVVSTNVAALDDVFGCLDQSNPQILVDPTRSERVIALGSILAKIPHMGVRELSPDDGVTLLRLTEQIGRIAERLERLSDLGISAGKTADGGAFRFESPSHTYGGPDRKDISDGLVRAVRPPLPNPRLVRQIIRQRQLRTRFFGDELFADPAWDILLDLTAARAEHARVSVTSLCIASGVPPTTALRWIGQMKDAGLVERVEDEADKRRAFIVLTDKAADGMARFFAELGKEAKRAV